MGNFPAVFNFNRLFLKPKPVHLQLNCRFSSIINLDSWIEEVFDILHRFQLVAFFWKDR